MARRSPTNKPRTMAEENSALAEAGRIMGSSLNINQVYERFAEVTGRLIPFDLLVISLLDENTRTVTVAHMAGIEVPGMSGEDLFGIISRDRPDLAERVLFVTGDTVSPRTRDFLASTARPWLNKPVRLQDLAGEVAMVCESASVPGQGR